MELVAIRREVDADNSCLFSSIGYLIDRENFGSDTGLKFRQIIVDYLLSDKFDKNLLELPKDEYIEYIINPKNWGGSVEVKMFSEIFQKQICCIDVKTNRIDVYGTEDNYDNIIYLLYNGVHYDPLVMNFDMNCDPITDITIFDSYDMAIMEIMRSLVKEYMKKGDYVDFNSLMCETCGIKFVSQEEAVVHGTTSEHWNFQQI
jgi:ubiquitin thioesterase OTU1